MSLAIKVGSFNILADGLSSSEFLCEGGDAGSTAWNVRCSKLVNILANMLLTCDVIVTQENDHFVKILDDLASFHGLVVGGVFGTEVSKPSNARTLNAARLLSRYQESNLKDAYSTAESSDYDLCNAYFKSGAYSAVDCTSFEQESPTFGPVFASIYGNSADDLYQSDDGVGIYYRADKLNLDSVLIPGRDAQIHTTPNMTVVTNMDYVLACTFRPHGTPSLFTLYGAHLRSGEEAAKEHERCRQLHAILEDSLCRPCPIIAMDSNSGVHYESAYPDVDIPTMHSGHSHTAEAAPTRIPGKLSTLIQQYNFVDAVGEAHQTGNECFKMRHGQGGQPSKHYQFMFDTIDKILVPKGTYIAPRVYDRSEYGFIRYDPIHRDELTKLRSSAEQRAELERECRGSERVNSTTCSVEAFGESHVLSGLYPNKHAPSDHPPVSCSIVLCA